ncbi:hypothetical protein BGZ79_009418 [Entomortierella chlamydospora]|nr:hypothetical protein BGZ79_009418 [Entomortierella chlamydospora]
MIVSSSLQRTETQKEAQDQEYLTRLVRTQTRVARLKEQAPSPLFIPHPVGASSDVPIPFANNQLPSTSTASLDIPQTGTSTVPYVHPCAESPDKNTPEYAGPFSGSTSPIEDTVPYIHPSCESPSAEQAESQPQSSNVHNGDSGGRTARTSSTSEIQMLYNPFENRGLNTPDNIPTANSEFSYSTVISNMSLHGDTDMSANSAIGDYDGRRISSPLSYRAGEGRAYGQGTFNFQGHSASSRTPFNQSRSPQAVRHAELFNQQQLIRNSRQERLPYQHHQLPQQEQRHEIEVLEDETWGGQWRRLSRRMYGTGSTNSVAVAPETLVDEKETGQDSIRKKKKRNKRESSSNEPLLDIEDDYMIVDGNGEEDDIEGAKAQPRRLNRPSCCIPLGFMSTFACLFMLGYNGVLSAFVYQASRFPVATNLPVFVLSIIFIFNAALSIFGFIATFVLYRSKSSKTRTSRAPRILFKSFYLISFFTFSLTSLGMLGWLVLNLFQNGSLDRMYLKQGTSLGSVPALTFESFLKRDGTDPDLWIVNIKIWIPAFVGIWLVQVYLWLCLRAYGKMVRNQRRLFDRRRLMMTIDMNGQR